MTHTPLLSSSDIIDDLILGFQIVLVVLSIGLSVMALYDVVFALRAGGDPTLATDMSKTQATTFNNPGFRDGRPGKRMGRNFFFLPVFLDINYSNLSIRRHFGLGDGLIG